MRRIIIPAALLVFGMAFTLGQTVIDPGSGKPVGSGDSTTPGSSTNPSKNPTSKPAKPPKYPVPTEQQIAQSKAMLEGIFEAAKEKCNPALHKFETAHFTVFSGGGKDTDKNVGDVMERMYKLLCSQFDVEPTETVWAGKCGIFILTENPPNQFANFVTKVDHLPDTIAKGAAGYFRSNTILSYIVMKPPGRSAFEVDYWKSTLIHESTHAFMSRYITEKTVPTWLNEGIAETSAVMVTNSRSLADRFRNANRAALGKSKIDEIACVFKEIRIGDQGQYDYGLAQSFVRYMIWRDKKAFIKFVTMCKEGSNDVDAMNECYKIDSHQKFIQAWGQWAKNAR